MIIMGADCHPGFQQNCVGGYRKTRVIYGSSPSVRTSKEDLLGVSIVVRITGAFQGDGVLYARRLTLRSHVLCRFFRRRLGQFRLIDCLRIADWVDHNVASGFSYRQIHHKPSIPRLSSPAYNRCLLKPRHYV
jgi:hypothetical protein